MQLPRTYDPHGGRKTDAEQVRDLRRLVDGYEALLHRVQLNFEVVLDGGAVRELLKRISRWSYAHRVGNGELSDEEQQRLVDHAFDRFADPI